MQKLLFLIMKLLATVNLGLHAVGGSYFTLFHFYAFISFSLCIADGINSPPLKSQVQYITVLTLVVSSTKSVVCAVCLVLLWRSRLFSVKSSKHMRTQ